MLCPLDLYLWELLNTAIARYMPLMQAWVQRMFSQICRRMSDHVLLCLQL